MSLWHSAIPSAVSGLVMSRSYDDILEGMFGAPAVTSKVLSWHGHTVNHSNHVSILTPQANRCDLGDFWFR